MKSVVVAICPFAPNSRGPPGWTQLRRNLVCVCVCLRCVSLPLPGSSATGQRDNQSLDCRSGSHTVGTVRLRRSLREEREQESRGC